MAIRKIAFGLLCGAGSLALATPAFAQAAAADERLDEEIVVTAQNRAENVQDVPIAIAVVSGETMRDKGVTDFSSLMKISPSVQITQDTTNVKVSVRGVGTSSIGEAQDQSIAVNIDGEYINRPTILNAATFDLERVEVLRGPQGTLYGRNSTGGAVNFISRKPGKDFGVNASATYGNYNLVTLEGGVDVPLGDIGGIRVAGIYTDRDGYNFHPNTVPTQLGGYVTRQGNRSGDDHRWGVRASLRLNPTENLTVDAAYEHIETDIIPASQAYVDLTQAANGPGATCALNGWKEVGPGTPGVQCVPANTNFLANIDRGSYNQVLTGLSTFKQTSDAVRGRIAYDLGAATFTYTGGYRKTNATGVNTLSPAYAFTNFGSPVETQSHELRLNGVTSGITWQTGAFFFKEKLNTNGGLYIPFIGANGGYVNYFRHPTTSKNWSVFGQVEVPLGEKITAVFGGRYTDDTRSGTWTNYAFAFNSGPIELTNQATLPLVNLTYKGNKFNWLAGLNYKPNSDTLVYAKVSTGYKAGGFDGTGTTFRPETNTAYEVGTKLNFGPGGHNIFNLSGFYYDYKDLQNDVLLNPSVGGQTFNAGKAVIWGVEAETVIRLSPNDTFTANVNYLHAEYKDFTATYNVFDPAVPTRTGLDLVTYPGDIANLSGNAIPQAPRWVISVGYDHVFDLGGAGTVTASASTRFKSKYFTDIFNYRDMQEKAFTQSDASLTWKPVGKRYSVQAYVQNIENYRPVLYAAYTAANTDDIINWQFGAPRTYGIRVSADF
ncbi:TonB-dependent receptor [Novosphingobium flavum]|uniref:TonB-dependent receptor n=1 Tax=Novosphingobium flavum TaxID=1778672 RepID=A0A7X1FSF9_9SPHN|nr:TonB-dependent receptor [Novosphingobium flavum]MBC2665497.1 TonB-dependent receptor [Novosphingobium flavum]